MSENRDYEIIIELLTERIINISKRNPNVLEILNVEELMSMKEYEYKDLQPTISQLQIALDDAQAMLSIYDPEEENYNDDSELDLNGDTECC